MSFKCFVLGLCCVGVLVACSEPTVKVQQDTGLPIKDLNGIEGLVSIFNQDKGVVRMVLLLSPT